MCDTILAAVISAVVSFSVAIIGWHLQKEARKMNLRPYLVMKTFAPVSNDGIVAEPVQYTLYNVGNGAALEIK